MVPPAARVDGDVAFEQGRLDEQRLEDEQSARGPCPIAYALQGI
jgi:hypothetical protein